MSHVNAVAFTILVVSFLSVTLIGFAAAKWRPAEDPSTAPPIPAGPRRARPRGSPPPAATAVPAPTASAAGARDRPRPAAARPRAPE